MAEFIEPLNLGVWIQSVLAGTPEIFIGLSIMIIFGMAAFFRMNILVTFCLIGIFLLMFSVFVSSPIIILIFIIGGLLIGYVLAKVFNN